jgi:hypothetical protein
MRLIRVKGFLREIEKFLSTGSHSRHKLLESHNSALWERAGSRGLYGHPQPLMLSGRKALDVATDADAIQVSADQRPPDSGRDPSLTAEASGLGRGGDRYGSCRKRKAGIRSRIPALPLQPLGVRDSALPEPAPPLGGVRHDPNSGRPSGRPFFVWAYCAGPILGSSAKVTRNRLVFESLSSRFRS